jgi:predicted dehydrogenase
VLEQVIGPLRLVTATLAQPWLASHRGSEHSWRFESRVAGGGILADTGDHLIDALLWTTGRAAIEVAAVQTRLDSGLDLVTAAALRLSDGIPATIALSGVSGSGVFELAYFGEKGRLLVTDRGLEQQDGSEPPRPVALPELSGSIDGDFVSAVLENTPLCCPADQALDTVRLQEAIARSAATGQLVRLT